MKHPGLPVLPESRSTGQDEVNIKQWANHRTLSSANADMETTKCKKDELGSILLEVVMGN